MQLYFQIALPGWGKGRNVRGLVTQLSGLSSVEIAYAPPVAVPLIVDELATPPEIPYACSAADLSDPPAFEPDQGYLSPAPIGIRCAGGVDVRRRPRRRHPRSGHRRGLPRARRPQAAPVHHGSPGGSVSRARPRRGSAGRTTARRPERPCKAFYLAIWSRRSGLNRGPADYESVITRSSLELLETS